MYMRVICSAIMLCSSQGTGQQGDCVPFKPRRGCFNKEENCRNTYQLYVMLHISQFWSAGLYYWNWGM